MSEEAAPGRIAVIWSPEARADIRAIERDTAMQILHCIDRYPTNRAGVKKLKQPRTGFRLRCGDYRAFFDLKHESAIEITGVKNRRVAYRTWLLKTALPERPLQQRGLARPRAADHSSGSGCRGGRTHCCPVLSHAFRHAAFRQAILTLVSATLLPPGR